MTLRYFALAMMVKNEEKYAIRSFESVKAEIDTFVIYDTGSTDGTVAEIQRWCAANNKICHIKHGSFVDFSASRNVLLDFADTVAREPYQLMLDASDEVKGDWSPWNVIAKEGAASAILCRQRWYTGGNETVTYFNTRIVRARDGSRYKGVVHEFLAVTEPDKIVNSTEGIEIYQNRTDDGGKSGGRFQRDYDMLLAEFKKNPDNERTIFYLARTCETLGKMDEAVFYFKLRTEKVNTFKEEIFWSYISLGNIYSKRNHLHLAKDALWRAVEQCPRAEAYDALVEIFKHEKLYRAAYCAARASCELEFPKDTILFVQQKDYDYTRWHLMGIVAFYVGELDAGRRACRMALQVNPDSQVDKDNLAFYL